MQTELIIDLQSNSKTRNICNKNVTKNSSVSNNLCRILHPENNRKRKNKYKKRKL